MAMYLSMKRVTLLLYAQRSILVLLFGFYVVVVNELNCYFMLFRDTI